MEDIDQPAESAPPPGVGTQLRNAREAKGLTLEQVAAQTRIPLRHLETIESGDYSRLPGRTYAVGFARTYAKTVGLDQGDVVAMVRAELDQQSGVEDQRPATFEPGDPARVPSRGLGWFAVFALILLLAGGFFFFRAMFAPAGELPSLVEQEQAEQAARAPSAAARQPEAAPTGGAVVFTALDGPVWVKFYDSSGKQLMQAEMARGDTYTVPADANGPLLWTGRPEALAITVGGRSIPKLAEVQTTMKDIPVTAEALLARNQPSPAPTAAPAGENRPGPTN